MPSQYGVIDYEGEYDYYNFNLVAGRTYYIEVVGSGWEQPLYDPVVSLYRNGNFVAYDDQGGGNNNARIVFTATQTANYTVEIASYDYQDVGAYHLLVNEDDYRGSVDLWESGYVFNIGGNGALGAVNTLASQNATINYDGDADLFGVSLIAGLTYTLEARGSATDNGSLDDPYLYLLDQYGNYLDEDDNNGIGLNASIDFRASTSGTHYLEAHSLYEEGTGDYAVFVSTGVATSASNNIVGLASRDAIDGAGGNDVIQGAGANDVLFGGTGNDTLRGQSGNDYLRGGTGVDVLIGGVGNDRFDFDLTSESTPTVRDVIRAGDSATAFQGAGTTVADVIDLSTLDANANASGNQAFLFGGTGIGRISVTTSGANSLVQGNTDSDSTFEFAVLIEDGGTLASAYRASDFIL